MFLVVDISKIGDLKEIVRRVFTDENEVESFVDNFPNYRKDGLELYGIDGNNHRVDKVNSWWDKKNRL